MAAPAVQELARRCVRLARYEPVWEPSSASVWLATAFADGHPFGPDRLAAFVREFEATGLNRRVQLLEPRVASDEELRSFHTATYLEFVREASTTGSGRLDGGDTPAFRGVYEAAATVVGATLNAMDAIMRGECRRAFVPIAGLHHAARGRAAGFCVFNDCGVAIEQLKRAGLTRIAYVDIDAHHGDGVFYAFEEDATVVFADLHEDGRYLYPGTGAAGETGRGAGQGMKLNVPLPPGADDEVFADVWPAVLAHLRNSRRSSSSCSAVRTASRAIRSPICGSRRRLTGAPRATSRASPISSATAGCWPWVAGATIAPTSPRPGPRW